MITDEQVEGIQCGRWDVENIFEIRQMIDKLCELNHGLES